MITGPELKPVKRQISAIVMVHIYKFQSFDEIIKVLSKLSKRDRAVFVLNDNLTQQKNLVIKFHENHPINIANLEFYLPMADSLRLIIAHYDKAMEQIFSEHISKYLELTNNQTHTIEVNKRLMKYDFAKAIICLFAEHKILSSSENIIVTLQDTCDYDES